MNNKDQSQKLQNLITEIEGQAILFDSNNWPQFQSICIEWGDKVAPFLNPEEKNKFNRELDTIRTVIHEPHLPSDFSGVPKENAFSKMKGIAKQNLQKLEIEAESGTVPNPTPDPTSTSTHKITKHENRKWWAIFVVTLLGVVFAYPTFHQFIKQMFAANQENAEKGNKGISSEKSGVHRQLSSLIRLAPRDESEHNSRHDRSNGGQPQGRRCIEVLSMVLSFAMRWGYDRFICINTS